MTRSRPSLLFVLAGLLAAALALPVAAAGHQVANLSGGVMTITGDQEHEGQPKPNDLVTVDYDSGANEFIFGQDVFGPHPGQCSPDSVHPLRIIHCPAALISQIHIDSGIGLDDVTVSVPAGTPVEVNLGADNDSFEGGSEVDKVLGGPGGDKVFGGGAADILNGGGSSDKLYGQGGADKLFGGAASDKLFGGPGNDTCKGGGGSNHLVGCN